MARTINELMTRDPRSVQATDTLLDAARHMRDGDVGAVIVQENGAVRGIVTDRDIVVRAIADGRDPSSVQAGDICTGDPVTLSPDQSAEDAVQLMRAHNVRRLPVVQDGRAIGIIAIGDLAMDRDPESALADISAASPNN